MEFWAALVVFLFSHSIIARRKIRAWLVSRVGEKNYLVAYSTLSILLLGWLIAAAIDAPRISLWPFVHATYWIPNIVMPLAFILLAAGFIVPGPLSIIPRNGRFDPEKPPFWIAVTRHPVLWGFFLWAASHIPPNGEYPLAFMFVLFAGFSLLGIRLVDRKRQRVYGMEEWRNLSRNAPSVPFSRKSFWQGHWRFTRYDLYALIAGFLLWAALYHIHGILFGMMPVPPLPWYG